MITIPKAQFAGTTSQLAARVQTFKDALEAHSTTVGVPAPREDDLVEYLARTSEGFEVEAPAPEVVQELTLEQRRSLALNDVNFAFEQAISRLTPGYPPSEKLSWPKQEAEALAWNAHDATPTPYMDALAAARGIPRLLLLEKTYAKVQAYTMASALAIGRRQAGEDAIDATADQASVEAARLAAVTEFHGLFV